MSRSFRKYLATWLCAGSAAMKKWKNRNDRSIRRKENLEWKMQNEIPLGGNYKKINDIWSSPSDGKITGNKNKKNYKHFGK